uniref:Uncharacterized protein n=1 Tax=Candidatus Kentrum sp. FM TaxID=2126340 RepID=A0A450VUT6_9GAMM|nr:MAG: hypothetical protein BECKFM1743A_GA0114220_1000340 [Candidatus Kentron sp. FM]VFK08568.1 MAG: hypothetical protein BECKFM1743B_GA0114221_100743 [Candidatus Kentron sp. FM]
MNGRIFLLGEERNVHANHSAAWPQPNSGKPCRMLVSPPGRTASEFIDRRLAMPIDEF